MAAANPPASGSPEAPKKKSKLILIAAIAAVLALGGAGGGYFWWKAKHAEEEDEDEAPPPKKKAKGDKSEKAEKGGKKDKKKSKKKESTPPVFVPLDVFTVNLQSSGRGTFLQVGITLEMTDAPSADALKAAMPAVRGQVLLLLAAKTAEELAKPEGKEKLAAEIVERIQQPAEGLPAVEGVERVHYSAFIIQ